MNASEQAATAEKSDSTPVPMTDEQRFYFDLRGWILLPSVLSDSEIEVMRAEVYCGAKLGDSFVSGRGFEGQLQNLLDHPAIVGILTEILSEDPFVSEDCYSFRCEGSFTTVRPPGWSKTERSDMGLPHVVVRFYTNPDGQAARRTTLIVLGLLGAFYLLPTIYGVLGRIYATDLIAAGRTDAVVL